MTPAAWGFVTVDLPALLACVFLLGLHSTLFGPVKFAYLPQYLGERELTGGNGLIEKGTFVAILLVFRSMFGISWLWFFGAVFLSSFPAFAKDVLHGNEQVASLLLVVFSIGMSVFAIDLNFASRGLPQPDVAWTLPQFMAQPAHWRVLADLALLSLFAGLYSVPMYALIQLRSQATHRARIIAANNILNALFMIASVPQVFLALGLANALVAGYIFLLVPEYLLRFVAFIASRIVYRFKVRGDEHIPVQGAAILVCNHVSFVDAVLLMAASPRPIRFIMDHRIFRTPVLGAMFRLAKAIPIAPQKVDASAYEYAFAEARRALDDGQLLCIFPEGGITHDGTLQPFKGGVMKILQTHPVPVVPIALHNLWGSYFSRAEGGKAMVRPFRRGAFSRVGLVAGPALPAADVSPERLQQRVAQLLGGP